MLGFNEENVKNAFREFDRQSMMELMYEKDRLISLQRQDMDSLKREINSLKQQLNDSNQKKK